MSRTYAKVVAASSVVIVITACTLQLPTETNEPAGISRPRFNLDCQLSGDQCNDLSVAISYLQGSDNARCRMLGDNARNRFDATGYGFRPGNNSVPNRYAYVAMNPNGPGQYTVSGWQSANGNVYMDDLGMAQLNEVMGGIVAHEEEHQLGMDGPSHNTGVASNTQTVCRNNVA